MSRKTSDVFRAGDITVDGTLNSNESQLIFRPRQKPYNPYTGQYYSLSSAQIDDPTLRINQYAANGTFENFGYLYDTQFNPIPPGTRISVAGGVGDPTQEPNPCIIYSYDNIHWDTWSNPTNLLAGGGCTALCVGGCNNIATNGGFWIAGTQGTHRLIFSFDGINWYASSATQGGGDFYLTTSCNAAAWSGSLWLAGGRGSNNIIRSTDGFFWQGSNNANTLFAQCNAVAWNGTFWLAGGIPLTPGGSTIAISYDGDTWTLVPVTYPTTGTPVTSLSISCNAIGWSGAQWVIGGEDVSGNTLAYSYDGTAWFPGTNSIFISCKAISWNGNSWAAAGVGANSLVTSFSGADWTPSIEGNRLLIEGGAVAVNKILPNASTVQQITVTATSSALTLVGASGETVIAFSKDGITWTPSTSASNAFPGGACLAFSWNGFTWAAGLTNSPPYTMGNSADGIIWGKNATGSSFLNISCNGITNNEVYWLAGGAGDTTRLIYSVDSNGITWADVTQSHTIFDASASNLVDPGVCNTVGWNGLLWVAGSNCKNNRLAYSYDISSNWAGSATGNAIFTTSCNSVAWNGLLWIAVGSANNNTSSRAAYSYDGITWTDISDAYVKGATRWVTVACNESVWIMGGKQVSGDCILFSYDGIHWTNAIGTGDLFQNGCTGVTWNGVVWVATGSGSNSVIYSYNGATWVNSYNGDGIFPTGAQSVGANRPQATTGATRPTPTLYAADIPSIGAVAYTPKDGRLNSLYPSNTLFLDDIHRNVGINIVPTAHLGVDGSASTPVLDISGDTGIYVESANPSLSLMNREATGTRIARIEMLDRNASCGWSLDDIRSANHLQVTSWKNQQPFTVLDITPGDTGAGQVDINGLDPLAPNGGALFVNGLTNQNDLAINVLGNVNINGNTSNGAALYVNGLSNPAIYVDGTVNLNGIDPSGSTLYVNGATNPLDLAITVSGNVNINGIDPSGAALFVNGLSNPADLALHVTGVTTLQETHATDFYVNRINPNGVNVNIGGDTQGITILPSASSVDTEIHANGNRRLALSSSFTNSTNQYLYWDGSAAFTYPYAGSLGGATFPWNNLYTTNINPNGANTSIGGTSGFTVQPGATVLLQKNSVASQIGFGGAGGSGGSYNAIWNGFNFFPSVTNQGALGAANAVWSNVWTDAINPYEITYPVINIKDSSGAESGSYTLPVGYTYSVTVKIVGSGGGGAHWLNYTPAPNAGGGAGGYIDTSQQLVAGGTVINWTIGASVGGSNNTSAPTNGSLGLEFAPLGNASAVQITGHPLWIAGGGGGAIIEAQYNVSTSTWDIQNAIGGTGGTVSIGTTPGSAGFYSASGAAPSTASPYPPYGFGADAGGGTSGPGYVQIIAAATSIPITNRLPGITQLDNIFASTNIGITAGTTQSGINIGSGFVIPVGSTILGSATYPWTEVATQKLIISNSPTLLGTGPVGPGTLQFSLSGLEKGVWLIYSAGNGGFNDCITQFSVIVYMQSGVIVGGGAMQANSELSTVVNFLNQSVLNIIIASVTTSSNWGLYARLLYATP